MMSKHKKIVVNLKRKLINRYFPLSCVLMTAVMALFFYYEQQEQRLDNHLITLSKKIKHNTFYPEQIIFKLQLNSEKKRKLHNRLALIVMLAMLVFLILFHRLKCKLDTLNTLLADIQKQQFALNQHAIVSRADAKGNITAVNDKFCEISGYSRAELLGQNHRIVKSDEHSPSKFKHMWQTISSGNIWHGQIKNKKKDGRFYWVNATIVPFLNAQGKPYHYISVRTDITHQKELERKLIEGQHFLEQVTDTMVQGVYALDSKGHCTFWNKEAENILGWTYQELGGKKLHTILYNTLEKNADLEKLTICATILKKLIYQSENDLFVHKKGTILPISITAVPLLEQDNVVGLVAVFSDMSKRKADEQRLRQAIMNAEQANQAKSNFLANMSHEIRTPMNGIMGMTELALETHLTLEQKDYLEIIKDSAAALLAIVNDILDFSKIEAGKLSLENIEFDLPDLLKKTSNLFMPKIQEKDLHFFLENTDNTNLPTRLLGDPGRLRQVLVNLLGNAIKFTAHGSITLRIDLQEKTPDRCCLLFQVTDTGMGIPEEKRASIFEAFSQADSSISREFGGTGLGLSISKQLIELMGGCIGLESEANVKTTFFFTAWFDYLSKQTQPDMSTVINTEPTAFFPTLQPLVEHNVIAQPGLAQSLRILLVEDNLINQKLAQKFLEKQDYSVKIAHNGLEAVNAFQQQTFDLILMDFQMPIMNGLEATEKIRQLESPRGGHIPIIAMTANALPEDEQRAFTAGMDGYLPKPIDFKELLRLIAHFCPAYAVSPVLPNSTLTQKLTPFCDWDKALTRLGKNHDILAVMVELFLKEKPCYVAALKSALQRQDAPTLKRECHTLKSLCATFGADNLAAQLLKLELLAGQQNFAQIAADLVNIEIDLDLLAQFLAKKVQPT